VDLRRQLGIVRKWFPLLVASVLLAAGAAFAFSSMQQKVYQAKATLIVGQSLSAVNPDYNQLLVSQRLSTTYAAVATKRPILDNVIKELGLTQTSDELAFRVWADAPTDSTLLNLTAQDSDPARAAAIANAMAEQLIAASPAIQGRQTDLQKSIDADLKATQDQINAIQAQMESLAGLASPKPADLATLETLQSRLITLRSTYAALLSYSVGNSSNLLAVVEPAVAPTSPVSPKPLLYTLLAAVAGLLLAAGVVAVVEYLDDTVKDADTVQEVAGLSTLGSITRMESERGRSEIYTLATLLYPRSPAAEAYRTLRANIEFASVAASVHTLLVTSANAGEGKTVTAANLAVAFAQAGRPVLLVDADLRKPGVHRIFDVPNMHGLTSLLRSDDVSLDAVAHPTEQANLRLLTSGPLPPNPAELLGSQRMRAILERLKAGADLVIFDAAPLQAVTDSAIMSSYLDATILVVDSGHTRRGALRQGRDILARAGANVLGVILNRIPKAAQSGYYRAYGDQDFREMAVGQDPSVTETSSKGSA
jgi:capsular exopolysaccharide synthesis family protein